MQISNYESERKCVLEHTLKAYNNGLFAGTSGNLSMYIPDKKLMVITPSNVPYEGMTIDDIVICDLNGNCIEGKHNPSSEWGLHAAIYKDREEFLAVVHTHSPYATGFAATHEEIPFFLIEMMPFLGGNVRVGDFAINGTKEVADNTVKAMKNRFAALMANHGAVAAGKDLDSAMLSATYLEDVAKIYTLAASHGEIKVLSKEVDTAMREKYNIQAD